LFVLLQREAELVKKTSDHYKMSSTYGTSAGGDVEKEPILPKTKPSLHPLPGQGGWGEREWAGGVSMRHLRRPFIDPALYNIEEDEEELKLGFKYLKEQTIELRDFFSVRLVAFQPRTVLIYTLLIVAILMDGIRPVILVSAKGDGPKYPFMFSVWVVLVKFLTVLFSLTMYYLALRRGETSSPLSIGKKTALSVYFVVPVLCYVASDVLNFVLFEHKVSPTLFACVKQSRIVLTAIMFRFILHRNVSPIQWIAVFQLCLASILFVAEDTSKPPPEGEITDHSEEMVGILWLLFKCLLDSIAVIWMDKYFKVLDDSGFPYAEQQVIFSLMSFASGLLFVLIYNRNDFMSGRPLFDGFNHAAWVSAAITAFYGILVSLVLRYLDSMIKQFQALCSVVVTTVMDQIVFGKVVTLTDSVAIMVILISVFLYKVGAASGKKQD
jgi:probable UDP-sugar transporter A4